MEITKYDTRLDRDRLPMLVKEKDFQYASKKEDLTDPEKVYQMFCTLENMDMLDVEHVFLLCLDTRLRPIGYFMVSKGTVSDCAMSPREIFIKALSVGASAVILAHNHPSGDTEPSEVDRRVTKQLREAGNILGINVLDHLIVGDGKFYSLRAEELGW